MSNIDLFKQELLQEADAIQKAAGRIDADQLEHAISLLKDCKGKIVLTGIGKAGIIARKISATLASTGTTSIFLHAAEGNHGDIGMLCTGDVVVAVSNSGSTEELLSIIPYLKYFQIPLIVMTGNLFSPLARAADAVLDCGVPESYEPLGIVPTASTTVALAVGDALSVLLLKEKGFSLADFARFHPGGNIGKKLLLKVSELMHSGEDLPWVDIAEGMSGVIVTMTSKKLGCAAVVDSEKRLLGMITDGDLRRHIHLKGTDLLSSTAGECMTASPKYCSAEMLAVGALNLMEKYQITMLPVVDEETRVIGMLHMHDLIRAGII
jgi:arabinose-5-phosphate isomerase